MSLLLLLAQVPSNVNSVLYGDEQFGDVEGGRFWAFHASGISIVNPESCSIDKTITKDGDGEGLPTSWYDGVYMEKTSEEHQGFVMINSGVTEFDSHENLEGGTGEVLAISTNLEDLDDPIKARIRVGGRPVHSYSVFKRDEVSFILFFIGFIVFIRS